jgi:hypothetical protein
MKIDASYMKYSTVHVPAGVISPTKDKDGYETIKHNA